jgi:hypothetical protein
LISATDGLVVVDTSGVDVGVRLGSFSGNFAASSFFNHAVVGGGVQSKFGDFLIGLNSHLQVLGALSVDLHASEGSGGHLTDDGNGVFFTDGDDLLSEADFITVGSVFNEVLHDDALGTALDLDESLSEFFKGSDESLLLDAGVDFLFEFRLVLRRDALAMFGDHVSVGSDARLLEDAHLGSLQISELLTIEVTADTASASADELRSHDFDAFSVEGDFEHVLEFTDDDDSIEEGLDFEDGLESDGVLDDVEFSLSQHLLLAVDEDTGQNGAGFGLEFDDVQSDDDLDLLLTAGTAGGDGNGEDARAVLDQEVFAVIKGIGVGLVIEGGDPLAFNLARGRGLLVGALLKKAVEDAIADRHGENVLEEVRKTDVFNFPFHTRALNLQLGFFTLAAEEGFDDEFVLFQGRDGVRFVAAFLDLEDEVGLDDVFDELRDRAEGDGIGDLDLEDHLVDGSGLVADLFADGRQLSAFGFFLDAALVFQGLADGLLLAFSLGEESFHQDLLLERFRLVAVEDEDLGLVLDVITQELFLVPLGLDFGEFSVDFGFNDEGFHEGGLVVDFSEALDEEALLLGSISDNDASGLLLIVRVDGSFNGERGGITLLQLSQQGLDLEQVELTDLASDLLLFADLDELFLSQADDLSLVADLDGLQAFFEFFFDVGRILQVFAELAVFKADISGGLDHLLLGFKALVDLEFGLVVLNAHLLDFFMVVHDLGELNDEVLSGSQLEGMSKSETSLKFLGDRASRVESDLNGNIADGSGHESSVDSSNRVGDLHELLDNGGIVKDGVVSDDLDGHFKTQDAGRVDFNLLDDMSRKDLLDSSRLAGGFNDFQRLLESVGLDLKVKHFNFLLDFFGALDDDLDLAFLVQKNLGFKRKSSVDSNVDSSTNELLGEGRDDTHVVLDLDVHDGEELAQQDIGDLGFFKFSLNHLLVFGLEETLNGEDNGSGLFQVDGETGIARSNDLDVEKLKSLGVFELHAFFEQLRFIGELIDKLLHGFEVEFGVESEDSFKTHELQVEDSFGVEDFTLLDSELLIDLLEFSSDGLGDFAFDLVEVHQLFENVVHTLSVQIEFQTLDLEGLVDDVHGEGELVGDKGFFSVDDLDAIDRNDLQVFEELAGVDVVRELDAGFNGLNQGKDVLEAHSDVQKFRNFSDQKALEGRVDERGDLLGRFEPGAKGNLLKFSGGRRSEWKDGNGGDANFRVLGGIVDQGKEDRADLGGVFASNALEVVDSQGADERLFSDLTFNDLNQRNEGLVVTELAESGKDDNLFLRKLLVNGFELGFQVGDPLFLDEDGFGVAEVAVDLDGEFNNHGSRVDAGTVQKVGESNSSNRVELRVLGLDSLDQGEDHVQEFRSGSLDVLEGSLQELGSIFKGNFLRFNQFLDEDNSGVGSNHGQNVVVEELGNLQGFLVTGFHESDDFNLNFLEFIKAERAEGLGNSHDVTSDIRRGRAALRGFESFLDDLDHEFLDLVVDFRLGNRHGEEKFRSNVHFRHGVKRIEAGEGSELLFLEGLIEFQLFRDGNGAQSLLQGILQEQSEQLLGFNGLHQGLESSDFDLEEFKFDGGSELHLFLSVPGDGVDGNHVLGDDLADVELLRSTADDIARSGQVSHQILTFSLGRIAESLDTSPGREDRALTAVVEVLGLGDLVVLLAFADEFSITSFLHELLHGDLGSVHGQGLHDLDLVDSPLFFQFTGLVKGKRVEGVAGLTITVEGGFHGVEERNVVDFGLSGLNLGKDNVVELLDLGLSVGAQVHLKLGQEGLLQVGDDDGLVLFDEKGLDDSALQVDLEGGHQRLADGLRDLLVDLERGHDLSVDNGELFIDGQELGIFKLDPEAVVGESLNADDRVELEAGVLRADLRDTG